MATVLFQFIPWGFGEVIYGQFLVPSQSKSALEKNKKTRASSVQKMPAFFNSDKISGKDIITSGETEVELLVSLKNSLKLPKKEALFRLNRVSMRNAISYIFILMFLLFLPDLIQNIVDFGKEESEIPYTMYVLQLIILYPFVILFMAIAGISVLAVLSFAIKEILARKLAYQQLWKMTAFALTLPLLIYTVLNFLPVHPAVNNVFSLVILYILMWKMIVVYPRKRK